VDFERAWADEYARLSAAEPLHGLDLDRLAEAAYLVGQDEESVDAWARAHRDWARAGDRRHAARAACRAAFVLLNNGDETRGGAWIDKARRSLDGDCAELGLLHYLEGLRGTFGGDAAVGRVQFSRATEIGERFDDVEVTTLARIGLGRCLIILGDIAEGLALLDEAMIAVTGGELSPTLIGDAYCTVIEGCRDTFELHRSQVWTAELSRWCDRQQALVPYRGQCLVHRAEILQLRGAWPEAMVEAERARTGGAVGAAWYQLAELHRLRGEESAAEQAYREASGFGREPQPGLAQLRLAQGRVDIAVAAIRRAVAEARDRALLVRLLPVHVEVLLAAGALEPARAACRELEEITAEHRNPVLDAVVSHARGAVDLAGHDAAAALISLRHAATVWRELDAPYETARARVLIGQACRKLGDDDAADLELAAARDVFTRLGAAPDLARLAPHGAHGLTPRELEVLRLLATGDTNRTIGRQLVISERTVDRHVSNILAKLGLPSRAAATAYAYEHRLV
jgi:DNA-binding CsgD family transcriptional regulator